MPVTSVSGWSRKALTYSPATQPAPRMPTPYFAVIYPLRSRDPQFLAQAYGGPGDVSRRVSRAAASCPAGLAGPRSIESGDPQDGAHPVQRELRVPEQAGLVGEPEDLRQVDDRAPALQAADHPEMRLVAVQVGDEHDPGLVVEGRVPEDVPGQRHGRRQDALEALHVAIVKRQEGGRRGGRDDVEGSQQSVGIATAIASERGRVVEIVAGVHVHPVRQPLAHDDLAPLVEQGELDTVYPVGVLLQDRQTHVHRAVEVV